MTTDSLFMRLRAAGAALLLAACNSSTSPPGPPLYLTSAAGDGQVWYYDNPLPMPLSVIATDAGGRPVPGVQVTWTVTSGAASGGVNPAQSTTNASGIATTVDSIGSATTRQTVSATFTGLAAPATFTEFAGAPPTSGGVTVSNNVFTPTNVAVQTGGTVTWTWNSGGTTHTITFVSGPSPLPAETVQNTGTKDITFTAVGTYSYHCTIHAGMSGTVTVVH